MKSFSQFFSRQLLIFIVLALIVIIIDFFLSAAFAFYEMNESKDVDKPNEVVYAVTEGLHATEGVYVLEGSAEEMLQKEGAWALLIGDDGTVAWEDHAPSEVPLYYTRNDIALFSHYGYIEEYPLFIWDREDGLLVVGFPKNSYVMYSRMWVSFDAAYRIPFYVLMVLFVDLLVFFSVYLISKRRTIKNVKPITDALDQLSTGKPVSLSLKGDLRDIGGRINETSRIITKKDQARDNWIRGVSHDIRTPLSLVIGYSDTLVESANLSQEERDAAACIRRQSMRIKELVLDLNAASRLEYDMQPLDVYQVFLARMLREIVSEYLNEGLMEAYEVELEIDEDARDFVFLGDERLMKRAVQNLIQNTVTHNPQGCSLTLSLNSQKEGSREQGCLTVADKGKGLNEEELALLRMRLLRAHELSDNELIVGDSSGYDTFHGLGLVLVEKIIRAHDGVLQIDSSEGQGFSAKIYLPLRHVS